MEAFPLLREEVDRIVSEHIRNNENRCKDHVRFLLDFELAYINTNHEVNFQFCGWTSPVKTPETIKHFRKLYLGFHWIYSSSKPSNKSNQETSPTQPSYSLWLVGLIWWRYGSIRARRTRILVCPNSRLINMVQGSRRKRQKIYDSPYRW